MNVAVQRTLHQGLWLSVNTPSTVAWSLPIPPARESSEFRVHSLVTLRMTHPRKFAGVASHYRKDKSHLVEYLGNLADGTFFWTCYPRHFGVTSLNCKVWHYPYGERLVVCAVLPDLERHHLPSMPQMSTFRAEDGGWRVESANLLVVNEKYSILSILRRVESSKSSPIESNFKK
jgi:hypothetical protein